MRTNKKKELGKKSKETLKELAVWRTGPFLWDGGTWTPFSAGCNIRMCATFLRETFLGNLTSSILISHEISLTSHVDIMMG